MVSIALPTCFGSDLFLHFVADFLVYIVVCLQLKNFIRNPLKHNTSEHASGTVHNFYESKYWNDYVKVSPVTLLSTGTFDGPLLVDSAVKSLTMARSCEPRISSCSRSVSTLSTTSLWH